MPVLPDVLLARAAADLGAAADSRAPADRLAAADPTGPQAVSTAISPALTPAVVLTRRTPRNMQPGCISIELHLMAQESSDTPESGGTPRFGDLLALARLSWVRQMSGGLEAMGYGEYRRSDAAVMRLLQRGPISIGRLAQRTGVTRQAARKMVDSLERRGLAMTSRHESDSRQTNVLLTDAGASYACAVVDVIERRNRELGERIDPADLAAADRVLRAVIVNDDGGRD